MSTISETKRKLTQDQHKTIAYWQDRLIQCELDIKRTEDRLLLDKKELEDMIARIAIQREKIHLKELARVKKQSLKMRIQAEIAYIQELDWHEPEPETVDLDEELEPKEQEEAKEDEIVLTPLSYDRWCAINASACVTCRTCGGSYAGRCICAYQRYVNDWNRKNKK